MTVIADLLEVVTNALAATLGGGRSRRVFPYGEPLRAVRTPLADLFSSLSEIRLFPQHRDRTIAIAVHIPNRTR